MSSCRLTFSQDKKAELYVALANERVDEMTWMVNNSKTLGLEAAAQRLDSYYNEDWRHYHWPGIRKWLSPRPVKGLRHRLPTVTIAATTNHTNGLASHRNLTLSSGATDKNAVTTPVPDYDFNYGSYSRDCLSKYLPPDTDRNNSLTVTGNQNNLNNNSKLMNILIYNAITQPDKIQQLLDSDKVPESVKPALRRALAASNMATRMLFLI